MLWIVEMCQCPIAGFITIQVQRPDQGLHLLFVSMPYSGLHYFSVYHTFTSYPNTFSTIINHFIEKSGATVFIYPLKKCHFMHFLAFLTPTGFLIGRLTHFFNYLLSSR